jgi:hypothetical protein
MKKLLIIETIPDSNDITEGMALKQSLEIMKKSWDKRTTRQMEINVEQAFTKKAFLDKIEEQTDFLHISAHGNKDNTINQHVLFIGKTKKKVIPDEIKNCNCKATGIFVSACCTGYNDLASAFFSDGREGFYLGPVSKPLFDEAFLVALQFHRGAFLEEFANKGVNAGKIRVGKRTQNLVLELKSVKRKYNLFEFPRDLKK